jgi:predicted nucleic acid-binding protein
MPSTDAPPPRPAVYLEPDDDYLVARARHARVDVIATGDLDLLALAGDDRSVITPRALIERLDDEPGLTEPS